MLLKFYSYSGKNCNIRNCICLVPRVSRAPRLGKASLPRRSPQACTSAPPPQTECGRRGRWAVVPGSASETRELKVPPWLTEAGRDDGGGGPESGKVWWRIDQVELWRWRCGRAGWLKPGPQGVGEVRYWRGEAELRGGSVGSVKGQAELASPWGKLHCLTQGPAEDMR